MCHWVLLQGESSSPLETEFCTVLIGCFWCFKANTLLCVTDVYNTKRKNELSLKQVRLGVASCHPHLTYSPSSTWSYPWCYPPFFVACWSLTSAMPHLYCLFVSSALVLLGLDLGLMWLHFLGTQMLFTWDKEWETMEESHFKYCICNYLFSQQNEEI